QALKKEKDALSRGRLEEIQREVARLTEEMTGLKSHWENEKKAIQSIRAAKQKIEDANQQMADAERKGDLGRAAELKYGTLPQLTAGSESAHRQLPLRRTDRRGQDRAGARARRIPLRRRIGADAARYERVHGEALGGAAHRRTSRVCRLRRGRAAHRGGPAAA